MNFPASNESIPNGRVQYLVSVFGQHVNARLRISHLAGQDFAAHLLGEIAYEQFVRPAGKLPGTNLHARFVLLDIYRHVIAARSFEQFRQVKTERLVTGSFQQGAEVVEPDRPALDLLSGNGRREEKRTDYRQKPAHRYFEFCL